jgi:hypothetical protein
MEKSSPELSVITSDFTYCFASAPVAPASSLAPAFPSTSARLIVPTVLPLPLRKIAVNDSTWNWFGSTSTPTRRPLLEYVSVTDVAPDV